MSISKAIVLASTLTMASTAASAAPVAVKSRPIEYSIGDQAFEGVFVYPQASKGKLPGVLMVPNWLGISDETRKQAERVAKLGVAVFAVDVYGKGVRPKGQQEAVALSGKYKADRKLFRARLL